MNPTSEPPTETGDPLRFLSESQRILVDARRRVCSTCDSNRSLTALTVNCRSCGCAGVSFLHGRCHLHKWPSRGSQETDCHLLKSDVASGQVEIDSAPTSMTVTDKPPGQRIRVAVAEYEREVRESYSSRMPAKFAAHGRRPPVIDRIAVVGHPSRVGGADTELDHQIRCWHAMGIEVHLCPTHPLDDHLRSMNMAERGCIYHEPGDWASLAGMHCISFCNGDFLKNIEQIRKHVKTTTFVNCMTWNFPLEIEAQRRGLIDYHLYQTDHGMNKVGETLSKGSETYRPLRFTPYFHAEDFPYSDDRPSETFRFGRISRPDADKFGARQMWIYETMTAPVLKEGVILGWDHRAEKKVGPPPGYVRTYAANTISQQAFYRFCEAIIMTTDTFENLPRVGFEAMASGSVLVVDDRGGWREQVEQGVTGWRCKSDREFVYLASRLAFESDERQRMRRAARERLELLWGISVATLSWASVFDSWETHNSNSVENAPAESTLAASL